MSSGHVLRRQDVAKESTWNLEDLFPSWDAWEAEYQALTETIPELTAYEGTLDQSPARLAAWLALYSQTQRRASRLRLYPYMQTVVDAGDTEAKGRLGQAMGLLGRLRAATAFAEPEIMALGPKLETWAEQNPDLTIYAHYFHDLLRQKAHRRSTEVEEILGMLADPFSNVFQTYSDLSNSDLQFGQAEDSQGNTYPIQQSNLQSHLNSIDRTRRCTAWERYNDSYMAMQNTLASNYITHVKQAVFTARVRGYDSVLASMLHPYSLPLDVFHNLLDTFKRHLPVWHRYWDVKRQALGLDRIHPYDVWAPLTQDPPEVDYTQAVAWLLQALAPLGEDYIEALRRACLEEGWVDWAPNREKRQGAQSLRAKNSHPFLWLSYDGSLGSVGTLAHELGHAMHSYLSDRSQPELYTDYSMTAAETASNFNQAMLRAYLTAAYADDNNLQLASIHEAMDNFHRYFFIMPTLARFELEVYTRAEQGKALTVTLLNELMADLFAEGYGDTMADDPERTASTWSQFLHLYMPYYTFQYSVGISAAHALSGHILAGTPGAAQDYLNFLRAGSSVYPIQLFRSAGVDIATPTPVEQTFGVLEKIIDRLQQLTNDRSSTP